uniref:Uncharacterized protein n=1 Tax=Hanusia phi TaxID=3032 RepID=A0A7S0HIM7_9CRYP|mmetsp:Transcript_2767/g.6601  ORF Transcript_2767/g.6601 Transcript_2767/m.6601 type:complete len:141 (+) Transcript_2767:154-576(+)
MLEQWSTGLLDVTSDYEILSVASLFCGAGVFFLAPNTALSVFNGRPSLLSGLAQPLQRLTKGVCNEKDSVLCINTCCLLSFPPVLLYWRSALREKYQIEGSCVSDCCASSLCCWCAILQEAREAKAREYHVQIPNAVRMK